MIFSQGTFNSAFKPDKSRGTAFSARLHVRQKKKMTIFGELAFEWVIQRFRSTYICICHSNIFRILKVLNLNWDFTAHSTLLRPCQFCQLTLSQFSGQALSPKRLTNTCAHTVASNWQLPFLNQRKWGNDSRKYFMINVHGSYVVELGFKLGIHGSVVRRAADCAPEFLTWTLPSLNLDTYCFISRGFTQKLIAE